MTAGVGFEPTSDLDGHCGPHPDRCEGLVLIDPVAFWKHSSESPWVPTDSDWEAIQADTKAR